MTTNTNFDPVYAEQAREEAEKALRSVARITQLQVSAKEIPTAIQHVRECSRFAARFADYARA